MALLDTGATTTGITPRVINALGLLSFDKRPLGSAQGDGQADRYVFRVGLHATAAGEGTSAFPYVFDATMGFGLNESFRLDALLGMDVLSQCDFRWIAPDMPFLVSVDTRFRTGSTLHL